MFRRSSSRSLAARQPRLTRGRRLFVETLEGRQMMASDVIDGLGVLGDVYSDEYAGQAYSYASSWVELLAARGVDMGTLGNTGDYRGNGYSFNWSLRNSTMVNLLSGHGAVNGLAGQAFNEHSVSHMVLMLGMNDFGETPSFNPAVTVYKGIYDGTLSESEIDATILQFTTLMGTVIDSLAAPNANVILATIPDPGDTPDFRARYPQAAGRQRVAAVIAEANQVIRETALSRNVPVIDLYALQKALLGIHSAPFSSLTIGGASFSNTGGTATSNLFTQDGLHPHTAIQGIVANAVMNAFNQAFGEDLPLISEQQLVTQLGRTYSGNTLNLNYNSYLTVPGLKVGLNFGQSGDSVNDFAARINELTSALSIASLNPTEMNQLRESLKTQLATAFTGTNITFTEDLNSLNGRFHQIQLGLANPPTGERNTVIGHFDQDWRNLEQSSVGFVAPDELAPLLPGIGTLSRATQIHYIRNALGFYVTQGVARSLGLTAADAFGRPEITPANYANTGGAQNVDYMSGNPALGFNPTVFQNATQFSFSPIARAKLLTALRVSNQRLATTAETTSSHGSIATAQSLNLATGAVPGLRSATVSRARIASAGQVDVYSIQAQVGQLITAQTLRTLEPLAAGNLDTVVRILNSSGTVIATSDDTYLGSNSFGQAGTQFQSELSLVLNVPAPATGTYYIEVVGRDNTTGEYELFAAVMNTNSGSYPWTNPENPLNTDGEPGVTPLDALVVINELNAPVYSAPDGSLMDPPNGVPPPYLDVDSDGYVTPLDALIVINYLNSHSSLVASGEGEAEGEGESMTGVVEAASGGSPLAALLPEVAPAGEASTSAKTDDAPPLSVSPNDLWASTDWIWTATQDEEEVVGHSSDQPSSIASTDADWLLLNS